MHEQVVAEPPWLAEARASFAARVLSEAADGTAYPCHFGTTAQQLGHNVFVCCERGDAQGLKPLADTLLEFYARTRGGPRRMSLIVFAGPPQAAPSLERDGAEFWRILRGLREHDPLPWPADRTEDCTDPRWQWCFNGEPWFVFAGSPAYRARRSRNLGPCLTIVFQTQRVFEGLSGATASGQLAKQHIRERLERYDAVGPHPHLGDPLHSSTHKWRQYLLPDDQRIVPADACPFGPPGPPG